MSGTIAQLGIAVDSGDAVQAATDLDKLAQAGVKAEAAADGVATGFTKAEAAAAALAATEAKLAQATEDAKARLLDMAKTSLDASQYVQKLKESTTSSATAMDVSGASAASLAALQKRLQAESDALAGTTERTVQATKQAAAATGVQAEGLQALLAKINPTVAALQKLDDQQAQLQKYKKAGLVDAGTFADFSAQIEASRQKLSGFSDDTQKTKTGLSGLALGSKQARENVLQLGNALAEGNIRIAAHNILEIGTNAGASALRLAAIAAPIALVAGGLLALGLAYSKGSAEADEYNKSLILTGNYAGVSSGQLGEMAKQVSATVGTTGAAAAALATLAGNGKIAGGAFVEVTQAAVSMQEATGKAISDTIAEFVKIADDPVKASIALNEQYHYLTQSVYSQIAALELQGDHAGAVKLATDQYADAINQRTPKILENLSLWEKAYNAVARAADGIKNVGRTNIDDEIETAKNNLVEAQNTDGLFQSKKSKDALVEFRRDQLTFLQDKKAAQIESAKLDGDELLARDKATAASVKIDAADQANLSTANKRNKLLDDYQKQLADIRAVNPSDKRLAPDAVTAHIQDINDKNKDPKAAAGQVDLTGFNDAQNALKTLQDTYSNTEKQLEASQKAGLISAGSYATQRAVLIRAEKEEVTAGYEAEIAALEAIKAKSSTTAEQRISLDQKIADSRTSMVKAQKDADTQLEVIATNETGRLKKQAEAVKVYTDALQQQVITLRNQGQRAANGLGQGDRERGLTDQQNSVDDRFNQQKLELANQYGDGSRGMSIDEYNAKLKALTATQDDLHKTVQSNFDDMTKAQGDWSAGASSAYQNYLDSAKDVAGQTKSLFTDAFDSMDDALANFALTGKLSFSDFAKSIIADLAKIAAKQASSAVLSSIFGLATSAASSYFGGGSSSGGSASDYSSGQLSGWAGVHQATGGAWDSGVQMFANGGAFSDSVVSTPTAFGMAGGRTGVMGEAGPEAIMPLTRGSNGKLGVQAVGGGAGQGTTTQVSVVVNVASDGSAQSTTDTAGYEQFGKDLGQFIEQKYQELMKRDLGNGGRIRMLAAGGR
ncbi:phage tail tape measure protein [Pseudomonas sp. NA-150]|uniref:phage tail tape measure protein n=1 Tax=Pseudomonas sp. NA-150 TaxID=3367525 RepID=UPI0037CAE231